MAQTALARDGLQFGAVIASADPANRLAWSVTGLGGSTAAWRGGVAGAAWYGSRPSLRVEALWLEQRATAQRNAADVDAFDLRVAGGSLGAELPVTGSSASQRLHVSAFVGAAQDGSQPVQSRAVLSGSYAVGSSIGWRRAIGASLRTAVGRLGDSSVARVSVGSYVSAFQVRLDLRAHRASRGTPRLEQFSAGGFAPPISDDASLAQRIALPALPSGIATGREVYDVRIARAAPLLPLPLTLYAQSVGTSWRVDRHDAVIGAEQSFALDNLGLVGLPRLRAQVGAARIIRGSLAGKGSAYFMLGWRP